MGGVKKSMFNFGDQGLFYSAIDYGARTTKNAAQNTAVIVAALDNIDDAGGGVLVVPHGIAHTFDPATQFPATSNALMVVLLTGDSFKLYSNKVLESTIGARIAAAFFTTPSAISYRIVDAVTPAYTYKFEVYNNATTPVIAGSSYDLCWFLPGGVNPVAAIARSGAKSGCMYLFNGLNVAGGAEVNSLKVSGQVQSSKSIQAPATGTSIQIADDVQYLVLNHAATIAALTVTLPQNPQDGNVVKLFSRSIVTALTLAAGSGETIETGHTVTTIAALGSLEYIFNSSDNKWYRVR